MAINIPDDFEGPTEGTFTTTGGANGRGGSYTLPTGPTGTTVKADQLTEGPERFKIQIRLGGPSGPVVAEQAVTVRDTSKNFYTLTPSVTEAISGQTVTFTFTTTGPNGTFYWRQDEGTLTASDFVVADGVDAMSGEFTTTGTGTTKTGTFTRTTTSTADGNMVIKIYDQDPAQEPPADPPPVALQNGSTDLSSTVEVTDDSGAFVLKIKTDEPLSAFWTRPTGTTDKTFTFYGVGTYDIDWGDGSTWEDVSGTQTKTYTKEGTYTIRVRNWRGDIRRHLPPLSIPTDAFKIKELQQWGTTQWTSCENMFCLAINMTGTFSDSPNLDFANLNCSRMFQSCPLFNGSLNASMNSWNVSKVTNMSGMFFGARAFNQDIGDWNVSNVTDMSLMFAGSNITPESATAFNQDIGDWNVSKVTNMSGMFLGAAAFNQPIGNWNVSNVTNMSYMFYSATAFNQPIGNWNVSNVTDMGGMFWAAGAFNQPIGNWNVSNVTNMSSMFQQTYVFNQPIGNWNVSKVTNMTAMFHQANSFNQSLGTWTLNSSVNLSSMLGTVSPTLGMDPENYSRTLIGWSNNPSTPNSRSLGALNRRHTNAVYGTGARTTGTAARSHLTTSTGGGGRGWSISTTDDAQITYNLYAPASVDEGASVTYTLGITGSATNDPFRLGTFYWTNSGTTSAADFADGSNGGEVTAVSVTTTRGQAQLTRTLASDLLTEGAETAAVQFRTGSLGGTVLGTTLAVTVNDTSTPLFYTLSPESATLYGESTITFTFTVNDVNRTFYWRDVGDLSPTDFSDGVKSGEFTTVGTGVIKTGTFTRSVVNVVDGTIAIRIYDQDPAEHPDAEPLENGEVALSGNVTVSSNQALGDFVLEIKTDQTLPSGWTRPTGTSASTFRFYGQGSYQVDWGEPGIAPVNYSNVTSHVDKTYATAGTYTIRVRNWTAGTDINGAPIPIRHAPPASTTTDAFKILKIVQWGDTQWASCENMFYNARNMEGDFSDAPNLTAPGLSMANMFFACLLFNGSPDASMDSWSVGSVTDMTQMFRSAVAFNQPIGNWNVGSVTNMRWMFLAASAFNQPIGSWNVASVTDMFGMFQSTGAFNQPIGDWNVSNVTNMSQMFSSARAFNQPIGNWNVSKVTTMGYMFYNNSIFNQPIGDWNVSNVTNMEWMFHTATAFNQNLGNWTLNSGVNLSAMLSQGTVSQGMSTENYSRTLIGWANNVFNRGGVPSGRTLVAGNRRYSTTNYGGSPYSTGASARAYLVGSPRSWSITGDAAGS